MPVHFVLKRFLPDYPEYGDLYEAIKSGRKTVEYRDDTEYWAKRLLSEKGQRVYSILQGIRGCIEYKGEFMKTDQCTFRVGYTKGPTLHATIKQILWYPANKQFEVHIEKVWEDKP